MVRNTFSPRRRRDAEKKGRKRWENAEGEESADGHRASIATVISGFSLWGMLQLAQRRHDSVFSLRIITSVYAQSADRLAKPLVPRSSLVMRDRYLRPSLKETKVTSAPSALSQFLLPFFSASLRLCGEKELEAF